LRCGHNLSSLAPELHQPRPSQLPSLSAPLISAVSPTHLSSLAPALCHFSSLAPALCQPRPSQLLSPTHFALCQPHPSQLPSPTRLFSPFSSKMADTTRTRGGTLSGCTLHPTQPLSPPQNTGWCGTRATTHHQSPASQLAEAGQQDLLTCSNNRHQPLWEWGKEAGV
jgi:hypothetical protein